MNKLNTALMSVLLLASVAGNMKADFGIGFGIGGNRGGIGIGFGVGPSHYDWYDDDYYYVGPRDYYYEPRGYWDDEGYWVDGRGYRTDHRRVIRAEKEHTGTTHTQKK